jgi:hypothetical protein
MFRQLLVGILLMPIALVSCKKQDNEGSSSFSISGVHDLNLSLLSIQTLNLSVVQTAGLKETVKISVAGLPEGVTVNASPGNKVSDFICLLSFDLLGHAFPGSYPIKVVGSSASYSKSYDMNVVVPAYNGFMVAGRHYYTRSTHRHELNYGIDFISTDQGGAVLECAIFEELPTGDGSYTYRIGGTGVGEPSMHVSLSGMGPGRYTLKGISDMTATIKINGGKVSVSIPELSLYTEDGKMYKDVSASASE